MGFASDRRNSMEQRPRPYLTAAVLCERVLIEKDDSISAIRIADKLTLQLRPGGLPADAKPLVAITLLVAVKSKEPVGESEIIVNAIRPSGEAKQVASLPFNLLG